MKMAAAADHCYFPSLDKIPETRLISWRTAYRALCDETAAVENTNLEKFLTDDESVALLSNSLSPFATPSQSTLNAFDTKTAPIHVSQHTSSGFKLNDLKDDAKWLSKEVQIEELTALRMTIIEWQERPADQLLYPTAVEGGMHRNSIALSSSVSAKSTTGGAGMDFTNEGYRRKRLLNFYLSEKNHLQKMSADLVNRAAVSKNHIQVRQTGSLRGRGTKNWIDELAGKVAETICATKSTSAAMKGCSRFVDRIVAIINLVDDQHSWPNAFLDEAQAQAYVDSLFSELVHVLRLFLADLRLLEGVPSPGPVKTWFSAMDKCNFLQDSNRFSAAAEVAQLLVSIISVEILKLQLVIGEIMGSAGADVPALRGDLYIKDDSAVSVLNETFQKCANAHIRIAAPAIYAWSIITSVVRDIAQIHKGIREAALEQGDAPTTRGARRNSRDFRSEIESLYYDNIVVGDWQGQSKDTTTHYAIIAVDRMDVYPFIMILSEAAKTIFGSSAECDTSLICNETLLDLIREGMPFVQYDVPIVDAILTILTPVDKSTNSRQHAALLADKLFYDSEQLRPAIIDQALARYPYEISPMLRLFTALAGAENRLNGTDRSPALVALLDSLRSFTQSVKDDFSTYHLIHEETDSNAMALSADLFIFQAKRDPASWNPEYAQRALPWYGEKAAKLIWKVDAGTEGVIVKESRPFVLKLEHPHSGLEYLGLLLSTFLASSNMVPVAVDASLDIHRAAETVTLFTALLSTALKESKEEALFVIGRLSFSLGEEQDILSVIAEVYQVQLLAHVDQQAQEGSLELVLACTEFLLVLVKVSPDRAWSILARCGLLGVVDGVVALAAVVSGEVQVGRYRFLRACVELHAAFLDDAISGLVKRKTRAPKAKNRFASNTVSLDLTPERTMSSVLNAFQKILLEAFQGLPDWQFADPSERCSITSGILDAFTKLQQSTYGVDVAKEPSKRLTNVLAPAAVALLNVCAPKVGPSPLISTFARILPDGLLAVKEATPMLYRALLIRQTISALQFLTMLVRATKSGVDLLAKNDHQVEDKTGATAQSAQKRAIELSWALLDSMPVLASLFASDHALKLDLTTLLSELIQTAGSGDGDPPSVLAQLDADAQISFLQVITQLDRPLCDVQVERRIWDFLSTIMRSKQQWFAVFLLTGKLPKKGSAQRDLDAVNTKPIMTYVLDQLSEITNLPPERAIGMLKFVATAQQMWAWASNDVRSHLDFLKKSLAWVDTLRAAPVRDPSSGASIISAKECEMAGYLCDIFAISLHAGLETGDKTILKHLVPKLSFLRDHGVTVNAYNRSLHRNLANNIKDKFPSSELSDFKRTEVNPAPYGSEYFYDRKFAASVFDHDVSWHGAAQTRQQGYAEEFSRANANLSLAHAQTRLLKSWKTLATTLCEWADQDGALQTELIQVAENCLRANADVHLDEPGAADVVNMRLELAFILISKLVSLKANDMRMKGLLRAAWNLVGASPIDYEVASAPEDLRYYRLLLQVLYLAVQPHIYIPKTKDGHVTEGERHDTEPCFTDIVSKIIANGFLALCGNIHSNIELALPADFALLTALLQAVLAVPGISAVHTILSDIITGSSVIRAALSIYSWADRIAESTGQNPVYGEIAVVFLLALSSVRPMADQLAIEGALTQLSCGTLSNYFRKPGGKGPFDDPQHMFVIWSEGFLPLCLNLLDAVGPPIAAEIARFLSSFPEQLRRAETSLQNEEPSVRNPRAGTITSGLVSEAHNLLMLSEVLTSDSARSAAEGIMAADIPALPYDTESVRGFIADLARPNSRKKVKSRTIPTTPLEERWLREPTNDEYGNILHSRVIKELVEISEAFGGSES